MPLQFRQITLNDVPYPLKIYAQIVMNNYVPKSRNRSPVDFRFPLRCFARKALSGFSKSLKISDDCVLNHSIREEVFATARTVTIDLVDAFLYVNEVQPVIFVHNGTASPITRSRM